MRIRADLHSDFKNHPFLKKVRDKLSSMIPGDLLNALGIINAGEKTNTQESENGIVWTYEGEEVIDNLEKALAKSKVDLSEWEVDKKEFKTYTVTMKIRRGDEDVPVTKTNYYCKIQFKRKEVTYQQIFDSIKESLGKKVKLNKVKNKGRVGVVSLSDFHIGADIRNLVKTKDYNINILRDYLIKMTDQINSMNFDSVELNLLGDFVESISGLNHPNTWKSLGQDMYGYNVIVICYKMIRDNLILNINNLTDVNILPGNHDRFTIDKRVDNVGGLGGLLAFMIQENIKNLNVSYNDLVLVKEIDGVNYIMTHGDKTMAKKSINLIADYGRRDMYNVILSGHLHSRKKETTQKITYISTDNINVDSLNYRHLVVPSLFTGNFYSESLGYTSSAGGIITENNGHGNVNVFDYSL
jgi:predicted phosphodiesterase